MAFDLIGLESWFVAIQGVSVSEPVWLAVWGATLMAAAALLVRPVKRAPARRQ